MESKEKVVVTKVKKSGRPEIYVKINETPEDVAKAIFSNVKPPDPKLRRVKKER